MGDMTRNLLRPGEPPAFDARAFHLRTWIWRKRWRVYVRVYPPLIGAAYFVLYLPLSVKFLWGIAFGLYVAQIIMVGHALTISAQFVMVVLLTGIFVCYVGSDDQEHAHPARFFWTNTVPSFLGIYSPFYAALKYNLNVNTRLICAGVGVGWSLITVYRVRRRRRIAVLAGQLEKEHSMWRFVMGLDPEPEDNGTPLSAPLDGYGAWLANKYTEKTRNDDTR